MERQTVAKFVFLLVITFGVLTVMLFNYFGSDDHKDVEEMFHDTEPERKDDKEVDEAYIEELDKQMEQTVEEEREAPQEEAEEVELEERDMDTLFQKTYGEDVLQKAKTMAEEVATLWVQEDFTIDNWKALVTPKYLKSIKKKKPSGNDVQREIKELSVAPAEEISNNEMVLGVFVSWDVIANDEKVNEQMDMMYVTVKQHEDEWLVSHVDATGASMEGGGQ
ncbi:hypothetical protein [Virgibacillus sp. Bac330]|uniref:hypothetical protein n=1 Tax=Virgibacillus sp. Bac330 TaxID=2419841 RepID=UPI000EF4E053|nr:hypothetical protein [Virgibacillus sp. Bac330]